MKFNIGQAETQDPVAPPTGDRPPFFLLQGLRCKFKKNYNRAPSPPIGRPGYIFEIFQNWTYIFEILNFLKYKKEKTANVGHAPVGWIIRRRVVVVRVDPFNKREKLGRMAPAKHWPQGVQCMAAAGLLFR